MMSGWPDIGRLRRVPRSELLRIVSERPLPEPWRLVRDLRTAAVSYYSTDAREARAIATRAVELADILQDDRARGWGYRALAEALAYSGRIRESEEAYAEATAALRRAQDGPTLGQLLVGRIQVLSLLGRQEQVERMAAEARRHLTVAGDDAYLARLAVSLGAVHFQRDDYQRALAEFDRALVLLKDRDELVVSIELNRAVALTNLGRVEDGLALYDQLEQESREHGFQLLEAQIQMNAAYVHVQQGDFDQGLARLAPASAYFRETRHPTFLATSQLHRAEAYQQMNLRREALELAEESAQIFREEGLGYDEALAHGQVAVAQLATGQAGAALKRLRRSRRLFEIEKNRSRVALTRLLWAESLFQRKRNRQAALHTEAALDTFRELRLVRWEAAATTLQARIALSRRGVDHREHIAALRRLLRRLSPAIYPIQTYRLLEALGEALERHGRTRDAERTYRTAVLCLEDLRLRMPTEDSKIAFLEDKVHLYDRLLAIELARPQPSTERLFEWMERSRAQSLWDRLRTSPDPESSVSPQNRSARQRLRRHLSWLHARVSQLELGSDQERAQAAALRRQLLTAEAEWSRHLRESRESNPRRARAGARHHGNVGVADGESLDALRSSLPAGWGYLSYHLGRDWAIAVVVTARAEHYCVLDPQLGSQLSRLCARLEFQWGAAALSAVHGPGSRGFDVLRQTTESILSQLHELLWAPIERLDLGSIQGWVVSPHGAVHRVPIHALRGPEGFLIDRFDISITPSARVWQRLAERQGADRPTSTKGSVWIGGVPSAHLPSVEKELRDVGRILRHHRPVTIFAPTVQAFCDEAPRAHYVHLAAHGSLRRDNPAFSFIQLADGPLFVHDLADLDFPGAEVVLTACSSGRAAAPAGDEWIGLARGFLQAGAASVVASLWPIEDGPTLELMTLYYENLARGAHAAAALASAMRTLRAARPHPWHWAAFAVLGGVPAGRVVAREERGQP